MLSLLILAAAQLTAADIPKANTFMSDAELEAFVTEARTKHSPGGSDPLWLIRMANKLMPMGPAKSLSLIDEMKSRRVNVGDEVTGEDLYWLINMMIDLPDRVKAPVPGIGVQPSAVPTAGAVAVRWPLAIVDDVPLIAPYTIMLDGGGKGEATTDYAFRLLKVGTWRTKPFKPRNDPFGAYDTIARNSAFQTRDMDNLCDKLSWQLQRLVRTAYRPRELPRYRMTGREAMDLFRTGFAGTRSKWDPKLELYVRLDGTYDPY